MNQENSIRNSQKSLHGSSKNSPQQRYEQAPNDFEANQSNFGNNNQNFTTNNNNAPNFHLDENLKNKLIDSANLQQGGNNIHSSTATEPLTEKRPRFHDMYDTVAPQRQSQAVQDLRETVNYTLENELEKYLFQLESSQKRFQELEREKAKMSEELNFWRQKAQQAEANKNEEQVYVQNLTNEQLIVVEQAHNLQINYLELQREKYQKALKQKLQEAEEWKLKAAQYEERFLTNNRISFELQGLQRRIQELIDANSVKSKELEDTRLILSQIEVTKADIRKLEEELHTAKELLDYHVQEGITLKAACDSLGYEITGARELHARLKENELKLKNGISDLTRELHNTVTHQEALLKELQVRGEILLSNIQKAQNLEQHNIETHQKVLEANIDSRQNDINAIGVENDHVGSELRAVISHADRLKLDANMHHERADSAEMEKRRQIALEHENQAQTINKLNRDQDFTRNVLGGHINQLHREVVSQHTEVLKNAGEIERTEIEKRNKAIEQNELQKRLNAWMVEYEVARQNQDNELKQQAIAQGQQLRNVDTIGQVQEAALVETVKNNDLVYRDNAIRTEQAHIRNNNFQSKLINTVNQERVLSGEAHHWMRTTQEVERQRHIELSNSLERKRVDEINLGNSIIYERNQVNRHNNNLVNHINVRESQNSGLRNLNNHTFNALNHTAFESQILNNDARNFQVTSDVIQSQAVNDSIVHESITRSQINNINNIRNSQKNVIIRDINHFQNVATHNANNANILRHSLNTTLRSPYIRYIQH